MQSLYRWPTLIEVSLHCIMQVPIAPACRTSSDILLYPPVLLYCQMLVLHYNCTSLVEVQYL